MTPYKVSVPLLWCPRYDFSRIARCIRILHLALYNTWATSPVQMSYMSQPYTNNELSGLIQLHKFCLRRWILNKVCRFKWLNRRYLLSIWHLISFLYRFAKVLCSSNVKIMMVWKISVSSHTLSNNLRHKLWI